MIAFPRHGLRISKAGDIVTVSMTDDPNDSSFKYYAHSRGSTLKDKFYIGAYEGSTTEETVNGEKVTKLRSLSGKDIKTFGNINNNRTLAQANGAPNGNGESGYDQIAFYPLTYLQAMYCLKYKNLTSQEVIGLENYNAISNSSLGASNIWGMDKKNGTTSSNTECVKLFGIEGLWGTIWSWLEECYISTYSNTNIIVLTATENFNNSNTNYIIHTLSTSKLTANYITKIIGSSELGFLPSFTSNGSETTYYCDFGNMALSNSYLYGGF